MCIHLVDSGEGSSLAISWDWNCLKGDIVEDRICSTGRTEDKVVTQPPPIAGSRVGISAASCALLSAAPGMDQDTLSFAPDTADVGTLLEAAGKIRRFLQTVDQRLATDGFFHQACDQSRALRHL